MAQTAAHLVDHVIPPVPVRQWVISVPKRLRGFLADRPAAVAALTRIFIEEIERLLGAAAGVTSDACAPAAARPRLGAVSFLHRFCSALNHHVHLHVCATEGVFVSAADGAGCDASPAFLPARPISQADLASLTETVRRRVVRWLRMQRLSMIRDADGRIARMRYVLQRRKAATWVGRVRGRRSTRPGANGAVELSPFDFLDRLAAPPTPPPRQASAGTGITGCLHRITHPHNINTHADPVQHWCRPTSTYVRNRYILFYISFRDLFL